MYDNKYTGYKITDKPNGIASFISATGSVDHVCKHGFTKRDGKCISYTEDIEADRYNREWHYKTDSSYINKLYNKQQFNTIMFSIRNGTYDESNNYKKSLGWYKFEKVKCFDGDMVSCDTLAKVHYEKGEYSNALQYELKTTNRRSIGGLYELIGDSFRTNGDEVNAIQSYKYARGYYNTSSDDYRRVDSKIPFEVTSGIVAATLLVVVCVIAVIN